MGAQAGEITVKGRTGYCTHDPPPASACYLPIVTGARSIHRGGGCLTARALPKGQHMAETTWQQHVIMSSTLDKLKTTHGIKGTKIMYNI